MSELRMRKNDNWDDVQLNWGAFRGLYVALPIMCVGLFIPISSICNAMGMNLFSMWACGGAPFLASLILVVFWVNDKPPSYGKDILKWWLFQIREFWYIKGWMDKPPILE